MCRKELFNTQTCVASTTVLLALIVTVSNVAIDNGIVGTPTVVCLQDRIRFLVNTRMPFYGHVFVKGFYQRPECHRTYVESTITEQELVFDVFFNGQCNVQRKRTYAPLTGVSQSTTVVVQFHRLFLTKIDGAFRLDCFYQEVSKTVSQGIQVSMLATSELSSQIEMPECRYEVLAGSRNGPVVRYAKIGDKLIHKWTCQKGTHGMLVHSCQVRDATGSNNYNLLDERGCAVDPVALGDLEYSSELTTAWAQTHAFKFADKLSIHFQCQITLCPVVSEQCRGITPPQCYKPYQNLALARETAEQHEHVFPDSLGLPTTSTHSASNSTEATTEATNKRTNQVTRSKEHDVDYKSDPVGSRVLPPHEILSSGDPANLNVELPQPRKNRRHPLFDDIDPVPSRVRRRLDTPLITAERRNDSEVDIDSLNETSLSENTLTVETGDVLIFSAEEANGAGALVSTPFAKDGSSPTESDATPRIVGETSLYAGERLCLSNAAANQLCVVVPLLFGAILIVVCLLQRRYYLHKMQKPADKWHPAL